MISRKNALIALVAGVVTGASTFPAASINQTFQKSSAERLLDTVASVPGITVSLGHDDCLGVYGFYASGEKQMVICTEEQDPSKWDEETQDTLRHEAIHLAQDCKAVRPFDLSFTFLMTEYELQQQIQASGIDADRINDSYRMMGADDFEVRSELEAWSMAPDLSNDEVRQIVASNCA